MYEELLAKKLIKPIKMEKLLKSHQQFEQFKKNNTILYENTLHLEFFKKEYLKHKPQLPPVLLDIFKKEVRLLLTLIYKLDNDNRILKLNI
jgi:hypothetical protein